MGSSDALELVLELELELLELEAGGVVLETLEGTALELGLAEGDAEEEGTSDDADEGTAELDDGTIELDGGADEGALDGGGVVGATEDGLLLAGGVVGATDDSAGSDVGATDDTGGTDREVADEIEDMAIGDQVGRLGVG